MSERSQYLLALYIVEHRRRPPVAPGRVAELVGRTSATAIEAFHRFDEEGLVDYEPYEGVELTGRGRDVAADLHETYVTLSWFFRSVLELDDYEDEAMQMAGVLSSDVAARLASTLPFEVPDEERGPAPMRTGEE
ncbi:metal-dependent transcriptional regulator [Halogeometricum sp. S1BR25-6]|uniref:Metal-dependent transcriptional regulator n=1 Tax=Halogeometricum salsisoli TaxID=2950536 RepID=A0ABU2GHW7_9EURY|nr:metal-dependent transcriptional regulator [Halogeometricum sp. S1BR25-6]MDS0299678.1 metal-dependent transcriptional regulator [Halogeometricum sp. S1BR25-6]